MSFSEEGLMAELRKSIKFVPPYVLKRYEEEALLLVQKREITIAKSMLSTNVPIGTIAFHTGLSEEVIRSIKVD